MQFFMISNDEKIAKYALQNGVDRLFIDLENIGKLERQGGMDTWKSNQTKDDVSRLRKALPNAHLLVRVNPMYENSKNEINEVIERGADSVMLPMFTRLDELERFIEYIDGRAEALPLVETIEALSLIPKILGKIYLTRLHIGLNDLHIQMKKTFMFELISDGTLDFICGELKHAGIQFGIGGIARAGEGIVSPEYLLGEHVRLGSDAVILSRSFHREVKSIDELKKTMDFPIEISKLRSIYNNFSAANLNVLEENKSATFNRIRDVVSLIQKKQRNKNE